MQKCSNTNWWPNNETSFYYIIGFIITYWHIVLLHFFFFLNELLTRAAIKSCSGEKICTLNLGEILPNICDREGVTSRFFIKNFALFLSNFLLFIQIPQSNYIWQSLPMATSVSKPFRGHLGIWKQHKNGRWFSDINVIFYTIQITFRVKN